MPVTLLRPAAIANDCGKVTNHVLTYALGQVLLLRRLNICGGIYGHEPEPADRCYDEPLQTKGFLVSVEHHLLALTRIGSKEEHPAVAETDMRMPIAIVVTPSMTTHSWLQSN